MAVFLYGTRILGIIAATTVLPRSVFKFHGHDGMKRNMSNKASRGQLCRLTKGEAGPNLAIHSGKLTWKLKRGSLQTTVLFKEPFSGCMLLFRSVSRFSVSMPFPTAQRLAKTPVVWYAEALRGDSHRLPLCAHPSVKASCIWSVRLWSKHCMGISQNHGP